MHELIISTYVGKSIQPRSLKTCGMTSIMGAAANGRRRPSRRGRRSNEEEAVQL